MSAQLKHADDDGDLSIFVSGNQVLIACRHGHAWTARLSIEPDVGPRQRRNTGDGEPALRAVLPDRERPGTHHSPGCDCDGDASELVKDGDPEGGALTPHLRRGVG